jgi:hypothetical protein
VHAVVFWFIGGQVLGYQLRRRAEQAPRPPPATTTDHEFVLV